LCIHSDGLAVCRSTSWHTDREETSLGMQVDDLELKRRFSPYVERCVLLLKANGVTADLFVEVLGTLANLCVPEFDFQALAQRHDLLNFLAKYAKPDAVDDDILLEVIMFVGVFMAGRCFSHACHPLHTAHTVQLGAIQCGCCITPLYVSQACPCSTWHSCLWKCLHLSSNDID
jgi:hypothetical protein